MKKTIVFIIVCMILGGVIYYLSSQLVLAHRDVSRLKNDITAINGEITYYRSASGELVANTRVIELKLNELKASFPAVVQEIRNMKIKPARVESYGQTAIETEKHIITTVRDSIRPVDGKIIRNVNYSDKYYNLTGFIMADTAKFNITGYDTLFQIIYRGKRYKPYLWIFSRRRLEQSIRTANPNNHITYSRYITIVK